MLAAAQVTMAAVLGAAVALVASPARRSPKRPAADVIDLDDDSADEADRVMREVADEAAELGSLLEDADEDHVVRTRMRGNKKGKHAARRQEGCDKQLIGRELALGCRQAGLGIAEREWSTFVLPPSPPSQRLRRARGRGTARCHRR